MKYLSLFSGYGGFELGIQQAYEDYRNLGRIQSGDAKRIESQDTKDERGMFNSGEPHCIGFSEIDKYAIQVYKKHFNHKEYGDITKLDPSTLPDFDLLVGGFPCQAFSIAGKRAGFEDTRGTLIYDVFRIIKEKHPKLVLLENVKGLLSHDNGRTFKTIITSLAELGYAVEWQVLNAKNFGVPQNRERVFIVGHLGGFSGRQVFPIGEAEKSDIQPTKELPVQISNTLRTNYSNGFSNETYVQSNQSGLRQIRELPNNTDSRGGQTYPADFRIRRLTPIECERLMSLPDGWTEYGFDADGYSEHCTGKLFNGGVPDCWDKEMFTNKISDTQRYKLCGNGVVVNVVKEIIKRILDK